MNALSAEVVLGTTQFLAQTPSNPSGPEFGKSSPVGLLVILALLIGVILLVRSMNRQLKKLPETFEPDHPELDQQQTKAPTGELSLLRARRNQRLYREEAQARILRRTR